MDVNTHTHTSRTYLLHFTTNPMTNYILFPKVFGPIGFPTFINKGWNMRPWILSYKGAWIVFAQEKIFFITSWRFYICSFFPYEIFNEAISKGLGMGLVENGPPKVVHYRPLDPRMLVKMLQMLRENFYILSHGLIISVLEFSSKRSIL